MTSMRKLRRRLLTWDRYAAATHRQLNLLSGYDRAWVAVAAERMRREVRAVYWPLDHAVDDGLDWPPPTDEERRRRDHLDACWDGCDDLHDDPCDYCEDPACLGDCWGEEDDQPTFPTVVTEYAFTERGLL